MKHTLLLIRCAASVVAGLVTLPSLAQAPAAQNAVVDARDISGMWELSYDGRRIPSPKLTPRATSPAEIARHRKGDAYTVRWCNLMGVPHVMDAARPLNIQVGADSVVMFANVPSSPRHAYFDRKEHVPADEWENSTTGDSIAHWEGDTLVVDTVGFSAVQGITTIPGGGYKTETSHLVERFKLMPGGRQLSVTSTWTDPAVFRAPHTYEYRYYRLPDTYEAPPAAPCDPWSDERAAFLGWTEGPGSHPLSSEPATPAKAPAARSTPASK